MALSSDGSGGVKMNEEKENKEKTIFFAMAIQDGGKFGEKWKEKIIDTFSDSNIIDLSGVYKQILHDDNGVPFYGGEWRGWEVLYQYEKKYFFPLIDQCDFVVAAEAWNHARRGKYTAKVIVEMGYALGVGKKVFGINIENWEIREIIKEEFNKIKKEKENEITFLKFLLKSL